MDRDTDFAPSERATAEQLARDNTAVLKETSAMAWADQIPQMLVLLNAQRQIVYANRWFLEVIAEDVENSAPVPDYVGKRPGEAIGCIHAAEGPGGCGTTRFCRTCGAVKAILAAQQLQRSVADECRIIRHTRAGQEALDLRVTASPVEVDHKPFQLFTLTDISHEKRREVLERIFFHDILNTAGAVQGIAALLQETDRWEPEIREMVDLLNQASDELIEEIQAQRNLAAAERGDLRVAPALVDTLDLVKRGVQAFKPRADRDGKMVAVDPATADAKLQTDPVLLGRVLQNLLKNAVEASAAGQRVTVGCRDLGDRVEFWVHNPAVMETDVQLQVFQRSFSTKGAGRGLGTHSVKLLTERYLKGSVAFTSTADGGTEFRVTYPKELSGI